MPITVKGLDRTVYRIERAADGTGPFQNGHSCAADRHAQRKGCGCSVYDPPGPNSDYCLRDFWEMVETLYDYRKSPYIFGFASEEQMRAWFCVNARRSLARHGYRLAVYEGRDVHFGARQVVFNNESKRLGYRPLFNRGEKHD